MMTREERAKQFVPFDAMKGLQEALRDREERHDRVEKRELSEEQSEQLSKSLQKIYPGCKIHIKYYCAFHNVEKDGCVSDIDEIYRKLKLDSEIIYFDDIYSVKIIDGVRKCK